jgi:hypothetical protein
MGWSSNPTGFNGYTPLKTINWRFVVFVVQRLFEPQGDTGAKI